MQPWISYPNLSISLQTHCTSFHLCYTSHQLSTLIQLLVHIVQWHSDVQLASSLLLLSATHTIIITPCSCPRPILPSLSHSSSISKHHFHFDVGAYRNPNCHLLSIEPGCDSANEIDLWSQGSKLMNRLDLALQVGEDVYCVSDNTIGVTDGIRWSHTHVIGTDLSLVHS
jgi:hypothetical protein